jgi:DNA-binding transcriptional ArsR family regulator
MLCSMTAAPTVTSRRRRDEPGAPGEPSRPPLDGSRLHAASATPVTAVPAGFAGRELLARFYRALGDPTRLALLEFCAEAERTGSECVAHAGLSQGRVSAHLACLVSCGLVSARREGRFAFYRVTDPRVAGLVGLGQELMADHAASIAACAKVSPAG